MKALCEKPGSLHSKRATRAKHQENGQNNSETKNNAFPYVDLSNKKEIYMSVITFLMKEFNLFSQDFAVIF